MQELTFLQSWLLDHRELQGRHPYNELFPVLHTALADGVLSSEEKDDIVWLCNRLRSTQYYEAAAADMQRLHGILAGIVADGAILESELRGLQTWLSEHEHLRTCWPYDEVDSLVTGVLSDGKIDDIEHERVRDVFSEFGANLDEKTVNTPIMQKDLTITGLCAVCPTITFSESQFCLTGASSRYSRSEFTAIITALGGNVVTSVSKKLNYLVIGADGNPCWAYACYGRKIEKATELRKKGAKLLLVHEHDFHDSVADLGRG